MERIVKTCFGDFVIEENGIARSVGDYDFYYHLPIGLNDEEIKDYFLTLKEMEE